MLGEHHIYYIAYAQCDHISSMCLQYTLIIKEYRYQRDYLEIL